VSELLVNDAPVHSGRVLIPRRGVWSADLVLDVEAVPEGGLLTLQRGDGTPLLVGTARRAAARSGRVELRLVGGAGGLARALGPKSYRSPTVQLLLQDLATEAGETLSSTLAPGLRTQVLPAWVRRAGLASHCLAGLARALGVTWRVLPDGTLWLGEETWPEVDPDHELLGDHATSASAEIATDTLPGELVPGTTFLGRRVSLVEHTIEPDRSRTLVRFERADAEDPELAEAATGPLAGLIRQVTQRTAYQALWAGKVVSQDDLGRIDVVLDRSDMPSLSAVPLLAPAPGVGLKVVAGARVLVSFANGDPQYPVAALWEPGAGTATELRLNATTLVLNGGSANVARAGDPVNPTEDFKLWLDGVATAAGVTPFPAATAIAVVAGGNVTVKA
jgi:hypothetical protein